MNEDFLNEDSAKELRIKEIDSHLEALNEELNGGFDSSESRSPHDIKAEIAQLNEEKDALLLELEEEEGGDPHL
ncbi:MAG TPA: hypothetical protein VN701_02605 [Candidatus Paceibacterota bacterium]|nr:hypothetical protein [Candidatus Paceibacterota bacterium]